MPPRVFSYERVSSAQQVGGRGLARQSGSAAAWCAERGLTLDTELRLSDAGASAYHGDNVADTGALGQFLSLAKAGALGPAPVLLVEAIDRLSRLELLDAVQDVIFGLLRAGVVIHTLEDGQRYDRDSVNNDLGRAIHLIAKVFAAADFSKRLSRRITDTWDDAYAEMEAGRLPRGNLFVPPWCERPEGEEPRLVPERAALVRKIFSLSREQGAGTIARHLNERGQPTLGRAATWTRAAVETLLRDPRVYGAVRVNNQRTLSRRRRLRSPRREGAERIFPDLLPAAVTKEDFDLTRAVMDSRRMPGQRRGPSDSMLFVGQGLVRCACGCRATVTSTRSKKAGSAPLRYVKCRANQDGRLLCGATGYPLAALNAHVLTRLHAGQLQQLLAADSGRSETVAAEAAAIERLQAQLLHAEQQQANAARLFKKALLDGCDDPLHREAVEESRFEVELARTALAGAQGRLAALRRDVNTEEFASAVEALFQAFAKGNDTTEQRQSVNRFLRRAGLQITLDNEGRRVGLALGDSEPVWMPFDVTTSTVALAAGTTSAVFKDLTITDASMAFLKALDPSDPGWAAWLESMKGTPMVSVTSLPPGWEKSAWAQAAKKSVAEMPPEIRAALAAMNGEGATGPQQS